MRFRSLLARISLFSALAATPAVAQIIEQGPFVTADSRYYLIRNGNYQQLLAFARSMGGDLASISDVQENSQLATQFGSFKPFIGLNDADSEGTFVWSDGSSFPFRSWGPGEPFNSDSRDFVRLATTSGQWDVVNSTASNFALVEIPASEPVRVPQEFPSLEAALSSGLREVLIAPGIYDIANTVQVTARVIRGSGRGLTTIRTGPRGRAMEFSDGADIADLTFFRLSSQLVFAATQGDFNIRRVDFTSVPTALGTFLTHEAGVLNLESCSISFAATAMIANDRVFATNTIFRDMSIVLSNSAADFRASHCSFVRIPPLFVFDTTGEASIYNSIFYPSSSTIGASLSYCLTPTPVAGEGNRTGDPLFADPAANDFRLLPGSPAIDAGSVIEYMRNQPQDFRDFDGNNRGTDDPASPDRRPGFLPVDLGPLEFQPPTATDTCKPDFNNDGFVDDTDFVTFAQFYDNFFCP